MIQTVTIDIINENALRLLKDLEELKLIRLHKVEAKTANNAWVSKHKGSMTKQPILEVNEQLNELRNGWE